MQCQWPRQGQLFCVSYKSYSLYISSSILCGCKNKGVRGRWVGVEISSSVQYYLVSTQNLPLRLIPLNFVSLLSEALLLMPIPCAPGGGDKAREPVRWMLRPREAEERPREALERGREAVVRGREAVLFCLFFISEQQK